MGHLTIQPPIDSKITAKVHVDTARIRSLRIGRCVYRPNSKFRTSVDMKIPNSSNGRSKKFPRGHPIKPANRREILPLEDVYAARARSASRTSHVRTYEEISISVAIEICSA